MKTLQLITITISAVFMIIGTNVVFAEQQLNNAILMPFKDNELVVVGKVVTVNRTVSENKTQYSIAVEKYLKNPKPFDLLTATGYGIRKEITDQFQQRYFNQAIFEKGDRVFLYLHQKDGQYVISPFSFLISRGDVIHPPDSATIRPGKNNYYGNDDITILGAIDKGYMYTSSAEYGSNSTVSIVVSNPNHEKYLIDQVDVKPDGSFIYQFKIKGKLGITGTYESDINIGSGGYGVTFDYIANPLMQFKSGIAAKDVTCKTGLQPVIKSEDLSPACVRPDTAYILIYSGWAKEIVTNTSTESSTLNKTTTNELKIDLSNQTYDAGYPVHVTLKGVNQDSTCKIPSISVRDESDQSIVFGPTPDRSYVGGCVDPWPITFYAGLEKNTLITKSTRYSILATLDNKTYQKEFTVIPSLYSNKNITADSTQIMPGYLTFTSCLPVSDVPNNGTLISYTGFDMYRRYLAGPDTGGIPEIDDYLLKPGSTGSFVLQVHQGQFSKDANLAGGLYFLSENLLNLDNSTVLNNKPLASEAHSGLVLSYTPSFAKAGPEGYATITTSISAQQNATRGTYWLYLPPGICGGDRVLLTIGEQPLAQPPDYIGYDLASHFAQGVGNPTQSDVTFEIINAGIHTFENCSVNYVSNNQTTTIKTFNVIPPGMEYKYHANLTSTSKVNGFLECKKPQITKVYPDVWVDVIPY
ncbi:MAG: hypothetical protein KGH99_00955 [Thaumarchaeota archaeon]|nr:hypothetical protein [Nitrososphaerota archaeon]